MEKLSIDYLKEADLEEVAAIEKQCFSMPWSKESFHSVLSNPNAVYLVAKDGETVVGYIGLYCILEEADINQVAVREDMRRKQIASKLLDAMFLKLQERGIKEITLEVRKSNAVAISLYESKGFIAEGIRPDFYERPIEDAIIMWKR